MINIPLNQSRKSSQLGEHSRTRWGNLPFIYVDAIFPFIQCNFAPLFNLDPGGYLVQKSLRGCAANMSSKISLLVYEWPLIKCKIWYTKGSIFSKFGQIWAKIGSNLRKFLFKIWPKIGPIGIWMNGLLFLEKLVFVWVYFQISWRHIPTKTKLEYPRDLDMEINEEVVTRYFPKNIINHKFV